jgi:hypothetical protein
MNFHINVLLGSGCSHSFLGTAWLSISGELAALKALD